jgi:acyl-CoA oxidase
MNKLATLYSLWRMDQNAGWFMVNGYFTAEIVQGIQAKINELCTELLPHSISLVDSFGVPNHFLGPIAFEDWVKNV